MEHSDKYYNHDLNLELKYHTEPVRMQFRSKLLNCYYKNYRTIFPNQSYTTNLKIMQDSRRLKKNSQSLLLRPYSCQTDTNSCDGVIYSTLLCSS